MAFKIDGEDSSKGKEMIQTRFEIGHDETGFFATIGEGDKQYVVDLVSTTRSEAFLEALELVEKSEQENDHVGQL